MIGEAAVDYFSLKGLEENDDDSGIMFCEDCRCEHNIYYMRGTVNELDGESREIVLGYYVCKFGDNIWSINGKRVD